jgi:hypothetical protein
MAENLLLIRKDNEGNLLWVKSISKYQIELISDSTILKLSKLKFNYFVHKKKWTTVFFISF